MQPWKAGAVPPNGLMAGSCKVYEKPPSASVRVITFGWSWDPHVAHEYDRHRLTPETGPVPLKSRTVPVCVTDVRLVAG
ncbi:MAG: hypothetical protein ACLP1X_06185 [Polyangiaceae bacterium]|jgi:hypothetical protein